MKSNDDTNNGSMIRSCYAGMVQLRYFGVYRRDDSMRDSVMDSNNDGMNHSIMIAWQAGMVQLRYFGVYRLDDSVNNGSIDSVNKSMDNSIRRFSKYRDNCIRSSVNILMVYLVVVVIS